MTSEPQDQPYLADYLRPVWSRKWFILVAVVLATAGTYFYFASKPKVYTAQTLVFTVNPGDPVTGTVGGSTGSDRQVANQAALLYSTSVATDVKRAIRFPGSAAQLLGSVQVKARSGEDFVVISATSGNPTLAAAIANGYAAAFVGLTNRANTRRTARAISIYQRQLDRLPATTRNLEQRSALRTQIQRLTLSLKLPPTNTRQVDKASPPTTPTEPKPVRNALFALILSLVLALAIAFGFERLDRRLKRPQDVERILQTPILAIVPTVSGSPLVNNDGRWGLNPTLRETMRTLRSNLDLATLDDRARTIVVSSALPGEGKSTVVADLALAMTEAGRTVCIVEADLRRPVFEHLDGVDQRGGLTEVLTGDVALEVALHDVNVDLPGLNTLARIRDLPPPAFGPGSGTNGDTPGVPQTLSLLCAGSRPANPSAVLESTRLTRLLDELAARFDVVIIDSAPMLAVTDTVPLVKYADGLILVTRLHVATRDSTQRLLGAVRRIPGTRVLGVVVNGLGRMDASGYGYGYDYGYTYAPVEDAPMSSKA